MNNEGLFKSNKKNSTQKKPLLDEASRCLDSSNDKQALLKRIVEMEKEMKVLKKTNQELMNKLNLKDAGTNQQNVALTFNSITITSPLNLDRKLITDKLIHKRVDSDKTYKSEIDEKINSFKAKFFVKQKQNSDDISKSDRASCVNMFKRKTKSLGGFEKLLFENSLNTKTLSKNITNTGISSFQPLNSNLLCPSSLVNQVQTSECISSRNNTNKPNNKLFGLSKIVSNQTKLSEKEEESSTNTQETILQKPKDLTDSSLNISNRLDTITSFENSNSGNPFAMVDKSNSNILCNSLQNSTVMGMKEDMRRSVSSKNYNMNKSSYNPFLVLKHHLDAVREIYLSPDFKSLVSVGEDLLINYWDIKKIIKNNKEVNEPYFTQRIHTTPIFSLSGPGEGNVMSNQDTPFIYTSGMDGLIRSSRLVTTEGNSHSMKHSQLRVHQDIIWDLNFHPRENLLASVSSDGSVKVTKGWEDKPFPSFYSHDSKSKQTRQVIFRNNYYNFIEIPTSSFWNKNDLTSLYVSYVSPYIKLYDIESGKSISDFCIDYNKNVPFECQQTNKIIFDDSNNLLISGHEDRHLRFFDSGQNKMVNNIVAHTDSVSTVCQGVRDFEILSGSHDGSLRCWDLRMYKLLYDIPAHRKKFEEGLLSLKANRSNKLVFSSGADGLVKVFQLS